MASFIDRLKTAPSGTGTLFQSIASSSWTPRRMKKLRWAK